MNNGFGNYMNYLKLMGIWPLCNKCTPNNTVPSVRVACSPEVSKIQNFLMDELFSLNKTWFNFHVNVNFMVNLKMC